MSETPGPRAMSAVDRERALRHRAVVEHRVHVSHQQYVRTSGAAEGADHQVAELRLAGVGAMRTPFHLPPVGPEPLLTQVGDPVDACRRVGPAVDVDHLLQVGDEGLVPFLGEVTQGVCVHERDASMVAFSAGPRRQRWREWLEPAIVDHAGAPVMIEDDHRRRSGARRGPGSARRQRRLPQRHLGHRARQLGRSGLAVLPGSRGRRDR